MKYDPNFFRGKKVLITGHTGFKGSWMCKVLLNAGADVFGYSLEAPTDPSLFNLCKLNEYMDSVLGDVRDLNHLLKAFERVQPEIVIHMAAQPIVRESYKDPVTTYNTNVMGTVNLLEAVRRTKSVRSVVNVTTDKVYLNKEWHWGYRENEELNGYDPYSNSKSCSELVTSSYKNSFFGGDSCKMADGRVVAISTCRAGNVIGGGDFAKDRIIPDCIKAMYKNEKIIVRNPFSTRPYQHVLEPVIAYLLVAQEQYKTPSLADTYNIGPNEADCWTTGELVTEFCKQWNAYSEGAEWINKHDGGPHEANLLKLDCSKIKNILGWRPKWDVKMSLNKIVEFAILENEPVAISKCIDKQIEEYLNITK